MMKSVEDFLNQHYKLDHAMVYSLGLDFKIEDLSFNEQFRPHELENAN